MPVRAWDSDAPVPASIVCGHPRPTNIDRCSTFLATATLEHRLDTPDRALADGLGESTRIPDRARGPSRVVGAVGRQPEHTTHLQWSGESTDEIVAQEPTIPVSRLGPGVREEDPNLVDGARCQSPDEHLRVPLDDTHVHQPVRLDTGQDVGDAPSVHVDGHQRIVPVTARVGHHQISPSTSDFQDRGARVAEHLARMETISILIDAPPIDQSLVDVVHLGAQSATPRTERPHQLILRVAPQHDVTVTAAGDSGNLRPRRPTVSIQLQVVLADYAVTHDGKIMMAGAGWSEVGSGTFASALAFMAKVPWDMTGRDISLRADLVDEDGRAVTINDNPVVLQIGFRVERPDGLRPGSDIDQNLAVQLPQLSLSPGRAYEWRITVDGEQRRDWNRGFFVRAPSV